MFGPVVHAGVLVDLVDISIVANKKVAVSALCQDDRMVSFSIEKHGISRVVAVSSGRASRVKGRACVSQRLMIIASY